MAKVIQAVVIRSSIRCRDNILPEKLIEIFKEKRGEDIKQYKQYLYGFFEEIYPSLLEKFLAATALKLSDVVSVFNSLPARGEKYRFQEYLDNGKFADSSD